MKRLAICLALLVSLLVPTASPVNASEKCLANFADSEWANGTPSGVKSLLGFDLVETINKPITRQPIHRYFLYGDHTITTTYSYVGKNCISRDVKVSTVINKQTLNYKFETVNEYINNQSRNFLWTENSIKYYADLKKDFSAKSFAVRSKQLLPNDQGSPSNIKELLLSKAEQYSGNLIYPAYAIIYFPTKCAHWLDSNNEKLYAINAGSAYAQSSAVITFQSEGECIGELKLSTYTDGLIPSGVNEKIADIKYVVASAPSTRTITCKKGKTTKKVKGTNPKCPTGYKKA